MEKASFFIIVISFLLLAVITWHTLVFDHDHQRELFGDGIQAVLHGEDRKRFFLDVCFLFLLAWGTAYIAVIYADLKYLLDYRRCFGGYKTLMIGQLPDPMKRALYSGRLHPKLCD